MKRFFFSLLALSAAFVSCTQSAVLETPDLFGTEITFNPYTGRTPETKATQIADANTLAAAGGFNVLCFINKEGESPSVYLDETVTKAGSSETEIADSDVIVTIYSSSSTRPAVPTTFPTRSGNDTDGYTATYTPGEGWTNDKVAASVWRAVTEWVKTGTDAEGNPTYAWSAWKISEIVASGYWDYPGTVYWPDSQSSTTLSFVAYSANAEGNIEWTTGKENEEFTYKVRTDIDNQVDLLATSFQENLSLNNTPSGMVNLQFQHLLSRVGFKLQANQTKDIDISITKVNLEGSMPTTGTINLKSTSAPALTPGTAETVTYLLMDDWSFQTTSSTEPKQIANSSDATNCYMMIMPHTSTNDKINVTYQLEGADPKNAVVDLAGFEFLAGKAYEFVLKVSTSSIEFYVEETDWNTGTTDESYPLVPGEENTLKTALSDNNRTATVTVTENKNYSKIGIQYNTDGSAWTNYGETYDYTEDSDFFTFTLPELNTPNTKYGVRSYAINEENETVYGEEVYFTTLPEVTTSISSYTSATATLVATMPDGSGDAQVEIGFYYSKEAFTDGNGTLIENTSNEYTLKKLDSNKTYYIQAYATNEGGTAYGNVVSFTTLVSDDPIIDWGEGNNGGEIIN